MLEKPGGSDDGGGTSGAARTIALGCLIGTVVAMVGVTLAMRAMDQSWSAAIGLGAFVAFWGGLGFGAMVGGVVHAERLERSSDRSPEMPTG